jgi:hypothetical protein
MVIDGDLGGARALEPDADGAWSATLPVSSFPYGDNEHTVVFYAAAPKVSSPLFKFMSSTHFDGQIVTTDDPIGDDVGPAGTYLYPQDPTFVGGASMDIEKLVIEAGPATLRLRFTMGEHSTVWNPANGFDHVCFNVYFDAPGLEGVTLLPKIQATVADIAGADSFAWDFTHFAYGWGNSLHKTLGASETVMGGAGAGAPDDQRGRREPHGHLRVPGVDLRARELGRREGARDDLGLRRHRRALPAALTRGRAVAGGRRGRDRPVHHGQRRAGRDPGRRVGRLTGRRVGARRRASPG